MSHCAPKAIETHYRGCRFRSRLEARWAVFLDTLGVRWVYEREGYDLGPAGWYLPDFWLADVSGGLWLEIKPEEPSAEDRRKMIGLAGATGRAVLCFNDCLEPWIDQEKRVSRDFGRRHWPGFDEYGVAWGWCDRCDKAVILPADHMSCAGWAEVVKQWKDDDSWHPKVRAAFTAATGARFEREAPHVSAPSDAEKLRQASSLYRRGE